MGLSVVLKTPEFALSPDEAENLAGATGCVMRHYNFEASQKAMDWANLIIALVIIYLPRFLLLTKKEKQPGNTIEMPGFGNVA